MEKKNTGLKVLAIIQIILILAIGGYIVYDKVLNNKAPNNDNKRISYISNISECSYSESQTSCEDSFNNIKLKFTRYDSLLINNNKIDFSNEILDSATIMGDTVIIESWPNGSGANVGSYFIRIFYKDGTEIFNFNNDEENRYYVLNTLKIIDNDIYFQTSSALGGESDAYRLPNGKEIGTCEDYKKYQGSIVGKTYRMTYTGETGRNSYTIPKIIDYDLLPTSEYCYE